MDFDLVIRNGSVVDGTGRPRFRADIGIQDGRIAAVAAGEPLVGTKTLDATGRMVAPGFIDLHSHFDWNLPLAGHVEALAPVLLQGVTTLVAGNCGSSPAPVTEGSVPLLARKLSAYGVQLGDNGQGAAYFRWRSFGEYLDALERDGILFNTAFLVGHGALRYAVMGSKPDAPTADEMNALIEITRRSLDEGAYGFSTGLGYEPGMYADADELIPLLRVTADAGKIYTVHSRSYSVVSPLYSREEATAHNVLSTREQLDLAKRAGVRLQLSHLLFHGRRTWPTHTTVIEDVERAAGEGLAVAFDSFPYTFGNTTINVNFPKWFLVGREENLRDPGALRRLEREMADRHEALGRDFGDIILMHGADPGLAEFEGLDFTEIAAGLGLNEFEAYMHVARESDGRARILQDTYSGDCDSEEPLRAIITHPLCAFMTDTLVFGEGYPNRATYGTYPRFLGHYSRDLGLFSLEEAVRKMTSFPAECIGLQEVGRVAEGNWADLVILDADTVADHTTPQRPDAAPTGIETVIVSGHIVAQAGEVVDEVPRGRVLRS